MRKFIATLLLLVAGCGPNKTHPPPGRPTLDAGTGGGGAGGGLSCVPNLDGKIDASELRAAYDVPVSYLVSPPGETRSVDVAGQSDGHGGFIWKLSQDFASDAKITLDAKPVATLWFASSFPDGQFAVPIDTEETIYGVYKSDDTAFFLLGLASVEENPSDGQTLWTYEEPVAIYRFPLKQGDSWVSTGEVKNGKFKGIPYASMDVYEVSDDALGKLELHDYSFTDVHRVRTNTTISPATGASLSTEQVSFLFECFGEVARVTSQPGEKTPDFTIAAEERRLGQ